MMPAYDVHPYVADARDDYADIHPLRNFLLVIYGRVLWD